MNPTYPNIEYTISLNLDDDDQLLVQNMNEDDDTAVTFFIIIPVRAFFANLSSAVCCINNSVNNRSIIKKCTLIIFGYTILLFQAFILWKFTDEHNLSKEVRILNCFSYSDFFFIPLYSTQKLSCKINKFLHICG